MKKIVQNIKTMYINISFHPLLIIDQWYASISKLGGGGVTLKNEINKIGEQNHTDSVKLSLN